MTNPDIRDLTRQELAGALIALGEKGTRADRLFTCLYRKGATDFAALDGIPRALQEKLAARYSLIPLPASEKLVSKIDGTIKLLFRFPDGGPAESVVLFNKKTVSACISSQSGCACGCTFCATGALGFRRDLKPSEIVAQLAACRRAAGKLDSVVFMGMGEPFLNWANVRKSILILSDNKGCNFPQTKITVSTVGVVPVIRELAGTRLEIKLAISLITADEKRAELAPMDRKYPLKEVIEAARHYCAKTGKAVFFEYILFDGVNDGPQDAVKLLELIKGVPCKLNLIMYNPLPGGAALPPGRVEKAKEFQKLIMAGGLRAHLRREKGTDISAACGQLTAAAQGGSAPAL